MITDDLSALILQNLGLQPTAEQEKVIFEWAEFLLARDDESIYLLRGYAGTGKTTLVGALVRTMRQLNQKVMLLAPTGRAAKVMSSYSGSKASTIHRHIYRQRTFGEDLFTAAPNLQKDTLYIVDEASMIANSGLSGGLFGDGRLLDDLVHYVYSSPGCRMILIGDTAQLPPVGEQLSPALSAEALSGYGMNVMWSELRQVVRQLSSSGILYNATMLRRAMGGYSPILPRLCTGCFADISVVSGMDLLETLEECYSRSGTDGTIVITRSNKRANIYNQGIRTRILGYEEEISGGEQLMVAKNKYLDGDSLIANGEMAVVRRIRNMHSMHGFNFAQATLRFPDDDDRELETMVLLDTLHSEAPALTQAQQQQLFMSVCADYPELRNKRDLYKAVRQDKYYSSLQVKYAYAITCHKAQGGQWENVFIDQGYITSESITEDYYRWLYTALTRATDKVFLVNWPEQQQSNEINEKDEEI